jgi:hypothetical protein
LKKTGLEVVAGLLRTAGYWVLAFFFSGFFSSVLVSAAGSSGFGASGFGSSFFSSISAVISSIGFGGGVVAIVHPIHAPIAIMATNVMRTGTATIQNLTSDAGAIDESH